jgi:hypothetical protein
MILAPLIFSTVSLCAPSNLSLHLGPGVSEQTGQHTVDLWLRNDGVSRCRIGGYPAVGIVGRGGRILPFRIHDGGDQQIRSAPAHAVLVDPGERAWLQINKYRCDLGDKQRARGIRVTVAGHSTSLMVPAPSDRDLSYCGAGDPGSRLDVSRLMSNHYAVTHLGVPRSHNPRRALAFTGSPTRWLGMAAMLMIVCGAAMVQLASRRGRRVARVSHRPDGVAARRE